MVAIKDVEAGFHPLVRGPAWTETAVGNLVRIREVSTAIADKLSHKGTATFPCWGLEGSQLFFRAFDELAANGWKKILSEMLRIFRGKWESYLAQPKLQSGKWMEKGGTSISTSRVDGMAAERRR